MRKTLDFPARVKIIPITTRDDTQIAERLPIHGDKSHSLPVCFVQLEGNKEDMMMEVGDVIHLDGLKAEYSLFGRDRFSACTLPNGDYVILDIEDDYVKLAWSDVGGYPSRKHRYRVQKLTIHSPC